MGFSCDVDLLIPRKLAVSPSYILLVHVDNVLGIAELDSRRLL